MTSHNEIAAVGMAMRNELMAGRILKIAEIYARLALGAAFLSAVADRFALAMVISLGIKAPLDYSAFGVSAAAFLLFAIQQSLKSGAG